MGWFERRRRRAQQEHDDEAQRVGAYEHLSAFVRTRRGVEAWLERPTNFNKPSILLVAFDGESTRRAVPDMEYGLAFAEEHGIPCYDAGVVPYPQRMRDYGLSQRRRS